MLDFTFHNPTTIVFGKTAMGKIAEYARPFGSKILLTYGGGSIFRNGVHTKVIDQLQDFDLREFGGIEPNPRVETLRKAVALCKEFQPGLILAVGGGSVIDAAKLIAAAARYEGDAWDLVVQPIPITNPIPLASVLTLSATGSEMNRGGVITNWATKQKLGYFNNACFPRFSILDPQNTFSVPPDQTAYGAVDIYSHVIEQYLNQAVNSPLQDRFCEGLLLTVIENAPIALGEPENYDARANLMWASTLALNGLIGAGVPGDWATHRIEHELSAFYDIPHAAGLAILTPRWMRTVFPTKAAKFTQYAERIFGLSGAPEVIIPQAIQRTCDFFASLGIRMSLSEWGISAEKFPTIIERATGKVGEIPLTAEQILAILESSL
jgi:alcohol dehydrogenase